MKQSIRTISTFKDIAHVIELRISKGITMEGDKIVSYHVWRDRNTEYQEFHRYDNFNDALFEYNWMIKQEFEENNVTA